MTTNIPQKRSNVQFSEESVSPQGNCDRLCASAFPLVQQGLSALLGFCMFYTVPVKMSVQEKNIAYSSCH